jgi:hypothetical protein
MRGRQEPPESSARGTFSQGISRNLGKPPSPLLHKSGMVHLKRKDRALVGTDAPAKGANKHLAEEVAGGRGRPETVREGLEGLV